MRPSNAATPAPDSSGSGRQIRALGRRLDRENNPRADGAQYFSRPHAGPVLRDYQAALVDGVGAAYRDGARSVLMVLPTGGGKTVIFSRVVRGAAAKSKRVLLLAHRVEIVEQIGAALDCEGVAHGLIAPDAPETSHAVQVASVATLARRIDGWAGAFDLIVIDEAHHAVAGSWGKILAAMPNAHILGVTATPERLDGRGLGDVFETMIEGPSTGDLIAEGHLSRPTVFAPTSAPDLTGVRTRMGDYEIGDLRAAMGGVIIESATAEYGRICPGTPAVTFCVDIAHSEAVAARFRSHGYRAAHVDGEMPARERRRLIAQLGTGELNVLTNCGLISEGVDVPAIGAAILLRPTQSLALYLQQVGRSLRPAPGKDRALILDFARNSLRHGLPDDSRTWSLASKPRRERPTSSASVRRCNECGAVNPANARECLECGASLMTPLERMEVAMKLRSEETARLGEQLRSMTYAQRIAWAGANEVRLRAVASACQYKKGWIFRRLQEMRGAA
ncbi:DEAD/DEAH box helicase [Methylocystis rosea]|uniref:ATP-dependent helicase n=1 Tax=Methylocystis rosea TaxID=173366 RepID=A0A3G8M1P4_9HYPH|nr:DEAD/DEAH box helicase [Methylocystis rosea]AZG75903.1 ATP-dependent helicase [Methylocystis rosea]